MCFVCGRTRPGGLLHRCIWGCGGRPGSSECANVWSAHNRSPSGSSLWNSPALPPCCLNTYKHTHTLLLLLILSPAYSCIYTFFFPTSLFSCSWLNFFNSNPKIPPGTFVPRYGYDVENTRLVFFCRKLRQNTQSRSSQEGSQTNKRHRECGHLSKQPPLSWLPIICHIKTRRKRNNLTK